MSSVSTLINFLPSFVKGGTHTLDDDVIDRWNHHLTTSLFVIFSIWLTTLQHFGSPISCVFPDHQKIYSTYAEHTCWMNNTYVVDLDQDVTSDTSRERQINYYQWVPIFLLLQAMLFYAPCALWEVVYPKCGVDLDSVLSTAAGMRASDDSSKKSLDFIVRQVDTYLDHYRKEPEGFCKGPWHYLRRLGKKQGNFLVLFYMVVKVLYVVNAIVQFCILGRFLSTDFSSYGWNVMKSWFENSVYPTSDAFPRHTLCDVMVRDHANINRITVQCVLPINFYNEKVFLIVWFWLVLTMALNIYSLVVWCVRLLGCRTKRFIKHYVKVNRNTQQDFDDKHYKAFERKYLRQDGVFILRLLKINVNGLIVSEVVEKLLSLSKENHPEYYAERPVESVESREACKGNGVLSHRQTSYV